MGMSGGGCFLPGDPPPSTNQTLITPSISGSTSTSATLTSPTITTPTITGGSITTTGAVLTTPTLTGSVVGTYTLAGTPTITAPAISAPVITGAATVAAGAVLTTPTILLTASAVIATGATGTDSAAVSAVCPAIIYANGTGVSGAGVGIPTGAAVVGSSYIFQNGMTGVLKIYAVGGTINGTTGTTAFSLTATGNLTAIASCTTAGAWRITGNT